MLAYELVFSATISGEPSAFNQGAYTAQLAEYLGISPSRVSLVVAPGSTVVTATIRVDSAAEAEAAGESLAFVSAADATSALGVDVVAVAPPTVEQVVVAAPSPPPTSPPPGSPPPPSPPPGECIFDLAALKCVTAWQLALVGLGVVAVLAGVIYCRYKGCCDERSVSITKRSRRTGKAGPRKTPRDDVKSRRSNLNAIRGHNLPEGRGVGEMATATPPGETASSGDLSNDSATAIALQTEVWAGWEEHEDDEGTPYFFNAITKTTSWTRPVSGTGGETARPLDSSGGTLDGRLQAATPSGGRVQARLPYCDDGQDIDEESARHNVSHGVGRHVSGFI